MSGPMQPVSPHDALSFSLSECWAVRIELEKQLMAARQEIERLTALLPKDQESKPEDPAFKQPPKPRGRKPKLQAV